MMTAKTTATRVEAITASPAEDMDDCPVCERETAYDGDRCTKCGRLWGVDYSLADIEDRHRREKAERIAAEQITINYSAAERLAQYLPESRQEDLRTALSMAALQALNESENAR